MEQNELEFEHDFCVALNMMSGLPYEDAVKQAKKDMKEVREVDDQ